MLEKVRSLLELLRNNVIPHFSSHMLLEVGKAWGDGMTEKAVWHIVFVQWTCPVLCPPRPSVPRCS